MNLISLENISKTLKDAPLFEGVSLGIEHDERIGLLGDNGSGKSTFLRLLTGTLLPDTGTIARNRELRISILEQQPQFTADCSITMALFEDNAPNIAILNGYRNALDSYEHHHGSEKELAQHISRMDEIHGWEIENTYQSLLTELGIPSSEHPMRVNTLSGGMQKKVALARTLSSNPNLLILDEPTNHLDIETIEWLENYLTSARIAVIIVTHDRYFLDAACTRIFEIDRRNIFTYQGNYSTFLEQKEQRTAVEMAGQSKINSILRRELEWLKRGPLARTGKDRGRKQRIEDLMDSRITDEKKQAEFSSSHRRLGKKVLELKEITKSYELRMIISPFSYSFKQGERIGLLGPNGSGKTTFLELITGRLLPDGGTIDSGINTEFGYYDQMSQPLPPDKTPLEFISDISESIPMADGSRVSASKFLELFGFDLSFHRIAISRLSGGETRRLYLISILIASPNFLVLDEPTNDLDIATLRRLENYLEQFPGCALVVSHDRAFLDRTTDYLFLFDGFGAIQGYAGSYSDLKADRSAPAAEKVQEKPAVKESRNNRERARKLSFKEKKEFETLLDEIEGMETEKAELEESFLHPSQNPEELEQRNRRYQKVIEIIEEKSLRWEFLASIDEGN